MCKAKVPSSSSSTKKALNPKAQEWRPKKAHNKNPPLLHSLPPPAPLSAAAPPFRFVPRVVALSGGRPLKQAPVAGGGGRRIKVIPPRLQRAATLQFSYYLVEEEPLRRPERKPKKSGRRAAARLEWRPKKSADDFSPPPSLKTTVMIKNIPNHLRRDFMLGFMDSYCKTFSLEYDFMYLPMDFRTKDNLGYAFVNFTSARAAHNFKLVLHNFKWNSIQTPEGKNFPSRKICHITWARIQGIENLRRRFQNSTFACDDPGFLPVYLNPPRNGWDPNPPSPLVVGGLCKTLNH